MKNVIFIFENEIVDVWENRRKVEVEKELVTADGEVILGFPGEILIIDASIDYHNKTIEELRELATEQNPDPEELQEKVTDLEQKISQLESIIQQLLSKESGGEDGMEL